MLTEEELERLKKLTKTNLFLTGQEYRLFHELLTDYHKLKSFKMQSSLTIPSTQLDELDHLP